MARLLAEAQRPLIIAGGGVVYSGATPELEALASSAGIPVAETFAGKGAVQQRAWWQLGGIGLEGTPATNDLAREADLVLTVGSRLTDFATASQSLFQHPGVRFASINVNPYDAGRLGATGIVADAKRALAALAEAVQRAGTTSPADWQERARARNRQWQVERAAALDPETPSTSRPCRPPNGPTPAPCSPRASSSGCCRSMPGPATSSSPPPAAPRRPGEGLGRHRGPPCPPGVRVLLHGL